MGTMKVMHPAKGHATLTWDETDKKSVKEVRAAFDELVAHGMTGIATVPTTDKVSTMDLATREFMPEAESITMIAPLQGG